VKVAILGCGPAGLLAAYGADRFGGAEVAIFSKKRPSHLYGAQYLHDDIPGINLPDPVEVKYELRGTAETYSLKVYGEEMTSRPGFKVSPEVLPETHKAWDIRAAYEWLYKQYEPLINPAKVDAVGLLSLLESKKFDLVISSIPRTELCFRKGEHQFLSQKVWALGDAPDRGQKVPIPIQPDVENTVVCNGHPDSAWYRYSNIYGYRTMEWPEMRRKPPLSGIAELVKPIATNCDCFPTVMYVGRYGQWEKGVLSHSAFLQATERVLS
jgi:hypothetical protein